MCLQHLDNALTVLSRNTHKALLMQCIVHAVIAQAATGQYFSMLLTCFLVLDVSGTAQILFVVTKQFETAVLTTGRDITVLLVVRSCGHYELLALLF